MRIVKILGILVAVVVVLIVAAMIYVATIDVNEYRDDIAVAAKDATGREVRLSGAMDLELGWDLRLTIEKKKQSLATARKRLHAVCTKTSSSTGKPRATQSRAANSMARSCIS